MHINVGNYLVPTSSEACLKIHNRFTSMTCILTGMAERLNSAVTLDQNTYEKQLQDDGGGVVTCCLAIQGSRASVTVNKAKAVRS